MDDADAILFESLRAIEVPVPEKASLKGITAEFFVAAAARAANVINAEAAAAAGSEPDKKLKEKMPKGLAARHRLCTALGSAVKSMGYNGDTSFNCFLYPNEKDARALLLFLVERLPKEDEEEEDNVDGADVVLNRSIRRALRQWNKGPVYQLDDEYFAARPGRKRARGLLAVGNFRFLRTYALRRVSATDPADAKSAFAKEHLPLVSRQPPAAEDVPASVLEACCGDAARAAEREAAMEEASEAGIDMKKRSKLLQRNRQGLMHAAFGQFRGKGGGNDGEAGEAGGEWDMSFADLVAGYRGANADLNGALGGAAGVGSMFAAAKQFAADNDDPVPTAAGDGNGGDGPAAGAGGGGGDGGDDAESKKGALDDEEQQAAWDAELESLTATLEQMEVDRLDANRAGEEMKMSIKMMSTGLLDERQKTDALERGYKLKKQTLSMLPDAAKNMKKLQDIYTATAKKLMQIGAEWEEHRRPLVSEIRGLKASIATRKLACKSKVDEMKTMRKEMKRMAVELREKEKRLKLLVDDWNKRPKTIDRSQYTTRIMESIRQVHKQKRTIANIMRDIRDVSQDINMTSQKVTRTETVADERMFKAAQTQAKKETAYVESYRNLATIRESFDELSGLIKSKARLESEKAEFQTKIQQLQSRGVDQNMEQVLVDLQQVKAENAALEKDLGKAAKKHKKKQKAPAAPPS